MSIVQRNDRSEQLEIYDRPLCIISEYRYRPAGHRGVDNNLERNFRFARNCQNIRIVPTGGLHLYYIGHPLGVLRL